MTQHTLPDFRVLREEISSAFEPFVQRHYAAHDLEWKRHVFRLWRKQFRDYVRIKLLGSKNKAGGGLQKDVKNDYEKFYGETVLSEHLSRDGQFIPCQWGNDRMLARGIGTKRVHHLLLKHAIETIRPESVLEVGSGYGVNLFVMAGYFPTIRLSGIELTEHGVVAAQQIRNMPSFPKEIQNFADGDVVDSMAHTRVEFHQGNAMKLPFPDKSFDVIYTVLALEAMEEIRHQALKELSRVARRFVLMIEPFRDFNDRGIRYYYHTNHQYFRGKIPELPQYGLEPVLVFSDFPRKVRLWPALVLAKPT